MKPRSGILAGGNWIVDKLKLIDTYPQQDALANILSESIGNGGSPCNILIDLANLGAEFPLAGVGLIGADADGEWISARCAKNRISAAQLRIHPTAHTSYTDVMTVQATGRRPFSISAETVPFWTKAILTLHPARQGFFIWGISCCLTA